MKIGILTFHRAINYGAVLQCYALFKTLKNKGHDVEIIDYRPEAIEKYRMYFRMKDFSNAKGIICKLRYIVSSLTLINSKRRTCAKFDEFLDENFKMSSIVTTVEDVPHHYDIVFFGSDQIWNPEICEGLDKIYYGQFPKENTKFVGYAASLGRLELITGSVKTLFSDFIKVYDSIAVRESTLKDFLIQQFNIHPDIVCDPSLLLSKEDCESIAVRPKDDKYVVVFNLDGNPNAISFAIKVASQIGAKVVMLGAVENPLHRHSCEVRAELSPAEFLGYIQYAECIVTNSFHATSFSLIMHKNFYTLLRANNNDRAKTILSVTGLESRLVDAKNDITFTPINYDGVDTKLNEYKKQSLDFIEKNL